MVRERRQQRERESIEGSNEGGCKVTLVAAERRLPQRGWLVPKIWRSLDLR